MTRHTAFKGLLVGTVCAMALAGTALAQSRDFSIPAGDLRGALDAYARQSGQQVIYRVDEVRGARSAGASGALSPQDALARVLAGSGFEVRTDSSGAIAIVRSAGPQGAAASAAADEAWEIAEVLVTGSTSTNADIRRSEDDPQPYVVFSADEIQRSPATTLEDFFRARLPMNTTQGAASQTAGSFSGSQSTINLRGFGPNQTLILVDGRRLPSVNFAGSFNQPDINGISLAWCCQSNANSSPLTGVRAGEARPMRRASATQPGRLSVGPCMSLC